MPSLLRLTPRGVSPRFTPCAVLRVCQRFIYPPCNKTVTPVKLSDNLATDLGYTDDKVAFLASKTNRAFQFTGSAGLTTIDLVFARTVEDHVLAICTRLAREGRLQEAT
jgi:hypothetical protein